ncbi:Protease production enhancer protein (plasmid) [Paracoccaceae bacterium]|nr:Protease production enhancer protein [Paracoccaceae bacterium]
MQSDTKKAAESSGNDKVISTSFRTVRDHPSSAPRIISMISGNPFEIEVLAALLHHIFPEVELRRFSSAAKWQDGESDSEIREIVLYNLGDQKISDPDVKEALQDFIAKTGNRQVIVISRNDDSLAVLDAIDCGASSYIPPNAGIDELIEAIRAPSSNSVVIPRSSMAILREALKSRVSSKPGLERYFTERQLAVARALQRGDANKTIAFELNLAESTVKVHIRNIMRKLKATNRTQAAFRLNELANGNSDIEVLPDDEDDH